jgi:hypothetical protein
LPLSTSGEITDEACRRIERELDLEEASTTLEREDEEIRRCEHRAGPYSGHSASGRRKILFRLMVRVRESQIAFSLI